MKFTQPCTFLLIIQDFTLKSLRLKPDKWVRMMVSDEQRNFITNFVERERPQVRKSIMRFDIFYCEAAAVIFQSICQSISVKSSSTI